MKGRYRKLSTRDIILISLAVSLGGAGTARAILKIARRYLWRKYSKKYRQNLEENTFRVTLYRLKKDGLVKNYKRGNYKLSEKGKAMTQLIERKNIYEKFKKTPGKVNTLIIFDVPEIQKKKRNSLRLELMELGFGPLQKSVWLGKSPLPDTFLDYLREMRLLSYLHIFTIERYGTVDKRIN